MLIVQAFAAIIMLLGQDCQSFAEPAGQHVGNLYSSNCQTVGYRILAYRILAVGLSSAGSTCEFLSCANLL